MISLNVQVEVYFQTSVIVQTLWGKLWKGFWSNVRWNNMIVLLYKASKGTFIWNFTKAGHFSGQPWKQNWSSIHQKVSVSIAANRIICLYSLSSPFWSKPFQFAHSKSRPFVHKLNSKYQRSFWDQVFRHILNLRVWWKWFLSNFTAHHSLICLSSLMIICRPKG